MRPWIAEAINSVLAQTYPHCEIIVVDDGSTDDTRALIESRYANRVHYHYQPNRGPGAARNAGLSLARGEFIQFFDADDIMEMDTLGARLVFLQGHPEYAVAYGPATVFWDDDPDHLFESANRQYYTSEDILKAEIHTPFLLLIMALARREWAVRVGGMDESLRSNEDWHFWLKIAAAGGLFAYVDGPPVARYRVRRNSRSQPATMHLLSGIQALEKIRPLVVNRPDYLSLKLDRAVAGWRYGYGYALLREGQRKQGLREILGSLCHNHDGLAAKLTQVVLSLLVPPDQIESEFHRVRSLFRRRPDDGKQGAAR